MKGGLLEAIADVDQAFDALYPPTWRMQSVFEADETPIQAHEIAAFVAASERLYRIRRWSRSASKRRRMTRDPFRVLRGR
jgi:hypothetical protein